MSTRVAHVVPVVEMGVRGEAMAMAAVAGEMPVLDTRNGWCRLQFAPPLRLLLLRRCSPFHPTAAAL